MSKYIKAMHVPGSNITDIINAHKHNSETVKNANKSILFSKVQISCHTKSLNKFTKSQIHMLCWQFCWFSYTLFHIYNMCRHKRHTPTERIVNKVINPVIFKAVMILLFFESTFVLVPWSGSYDFMLFPKIEAMNTTTNMLNHITRSKSWWPQLGLILCV